MNSILLWEKNSYLGVILATTTVGFLLLWRLSPSILSTLSITAIILTLLDYLGPMMTSHFCHPEKWTSTKERKLESICLSLAANKIYFTNLIKTFYQMKRDRPKSVSNIRCSFFLFRNNQVKVKWCFSNISDRLKNFFPHFFFVQIKIKFTSEIIYSAYICYNIFMLSKNVYKLS